MSDEAENLNKCQLYLISPAAIELDKFIDSLHDAFTGGQIGVFQLRLKNVNDDFILKAGKIIRDICWQYGTQFILNDRPDLAAKLDANGVHLGKEDGSLIEARRIIGKDKIIGVSCYDLPDRAIELAEKGADYVAFGAFYPTKTKANTASPNPDILNWWVSNSVVPCVAIGGINPQNCGVLVEKGADFIAVVSYIWEHKMGPKMAVSELLKAIS